MRRWESMDTSLASGIRREDCRTGGPSHHRPSRRTVRRMRVETNEEFVKGGKKMVQLSTSYYLK